MKIGAENLERTLILNLTNYHVWDSYKTESRFLVEGWKIKRALVNKEKSPYFYESQIGIPIISTFRGLCFYVFYSAIEYTICRNSNTNISMWDYWQFHKIIGEELGIQGLMLYCESRDCKYSIMSGANEMGRTGLLAYNLVRGVIDVYFDNCNISDFNMYDREGNELPCKIDNLNEVLEVFHKVGSACAIAGLHNKESKMWGGPASMKALFCIQK